MNLVIFAVQINRYKVSCVCISSYTEFYVDSFETLQAMVWK